MQRPRPLVTGCVSILLLAGTLFAGDGLRIPLPKRSKVTPVQKLNQDGVAAVKKHNYEKAKQLFYKAYLLDPDDPFTLNNLGYIAELEGDLDRAQRFYQLSAEQRSDATVVKSTSPSVEGKAVSQVAGKAEDAAMSINRFNVQAIALLNKDRAPEADLLLQKALALDPKNPFTLNNLGYTREKEGEYEQAMNFYQRAALTRSEEPIVVTMNPDWRGKPIAEIAAGNADKLRKLMSKEQTAESRVARLNLQAVSAINRNDHETARKDFLEAYKLDPNNAFTLNNMGYLAEMDGDRETADFYYAKAAEARGQSGRVAMATRVDAEGKPLGEVARVSDTKVVNKIETVRAAREREGGPVILRRRDNSVVTEPEKPPAPPADESQGPAPQQEQQPQTEILQPLPENQQPGNYPRPPQNEPAERGQQGIAAPQQVPQPNSGVSQPLPEDRQPNQAQPPQETPGQQPAVQQGPSNNGLLMPLPDDKQPRQTQPPQSQQPQAQPTVPHNAPQGQVDNGLIMPLPDNQQPASTVQPSGMPPAPTQAQPQTPPQPQQGQVDNGLIMPLPDTQQPPQGSQQKKPDQKKNPKPKKIIIQN